MNTEDRKKAYLNIKFDHATKKEMMVSTMSNSSSCNYLYELMFLVKNIKNWESFLNDKQIRILKLYLSYKNINEVANILGLAYGSIHSALFGNVKNEQGIYGKLKKIYTMLNTKNPKDIGSVLLNKQNFINEKKKEIQDKDLKLDLLNFVDKIPDYEDFLTKRQIEVLNLFIEYKSYTKVDETLKTGSWTVLYGKTKINPKGVYGKLKDIYNKRFK